MHNVLLLWALWCFFHSLLLTPAIKNFLCSGSSLRIAAYRIVYNLLATFSLIPLVWYTHLIPQRVLFQFPGPWKLVQVLLLGYALLLFYLGARAYDLAFFSGTRQLKSYLDKFPAPPMEFHQNGVLSYIRHPWYSGGLALLWGIGPVTEINIGVKLLLSAYLIVGAVLEEKRLKKELGNDYREYCDKVPMFFPWKGKQP